MGIAKYIERTITKVGRDYVYFDKKRATFTNNNHYPQSGEPLAQDDYYKYYLDKDSAKYGEQLDVVRSKLNSYDMNQLRTDQVRDIARILRWKI